MRIRRWLSSALVVALISAAAPVNTWAADASSSKNIKPVRLQAAIRQAVAEAATAPALQLQSTPPAPAPAKRGVRRQAVTAGGGGHTGMIIGLLTTVVGIGATVYMVKEMQKTEKTITSGQ